jgi:hypothetical protein
LDKLVASGDYFSEEFGGHSVYIYLEYEKKDSKKFMGGQ